MRDGRGMGGHGSGRAGDHGHFVYTRGSPFHAAENLVSFFSALNPIQVHTNKAADGKATGGDMEFVTL